MPTRTIWSCTTASQLYIARLCKYVYVSALTLTKIQQFDLILSKLSTNVQWALHPSTICLCRWLDHNTLPISPSLSVLLACRNSPRSRWHSMSYNWWRSGTSLSWASRWARDWPSFQRYSHWRVSLLRIRCTTYTMPTDLGASLFANASLVLCKLMRASFIFFAAVWFFFIKCALIPVLLQIYHDGHSPLHVYAHLCA